MEKVALFDFCETLANFQTADRYVSFVRSRMNCGQMRRKGALYRWCRKFRLIDIASVFLPHSSISKRFILYSLRGVQFDVLDKFAEEYYLTQIRTNLIKESVAELKQMQEAGYRIMLLSGGYDIYLKYFAEEFGVSDIVSTSIGFRNGVCTGFFNGKDCLGKNKIAMLEQYCKRVGIEIDRRISFAYTDSRTDLPMLGYVGNAVVVRRRDVPRWYQENGCYKEIVWEM